MPADNKEILMLIKGSDLLLHLKMVCNFPKVIERIRSKIKPDKLKLIILQNSKNKNSSTQDDSIDQHDR